MRPGSENKSSNDRLVLTARELAMLLGISERHLWSMNRNGRLGPEPIRFGKVARWTRSSIEAWLEAGAPPRDQWRGSGPNENIRKVS